MEYPAKYDFFLSFKALFNEKEEFIDYILIEVSENFKNLCIIKPEHLIGKRLSTLFGDNEEDFLSSKEFYYNMIPNTHRKFEKYIKELDRWYLINIYSNEREYLILNYTDMTSLFNSLDSSFKTAICS